MDVMLTSTESDSRPTARSRRPTRGCCGARGASEPGILAVAELAECRCPDFCDRDHDNE